MGKHTAQFAEDPFALPARVYVCKSVNAALADEVASLQSGASHMLSPEFTRFVRDVLATVATGIDGFAFKSIRENLDSHLKDLVQDHLQHEDNKRAVGQASSAPGDRDGNWSTSFLHSVRWADAATIFANETARR